MTNITVVNRTAERGQQLVDLLNEKTPTSAEFVQWNGEFDIPDGTDIVINSTSIGLYPDVDARLDLNINTLKSGMVVADVIPNPPRTRLVREAEERGCTMLDGLGMHVNQGVISIRYWTGIDVDSSVMRAALEEIFGG